MRPIEALRCSDVPMKPVERRAAASVRYHGARLWHFDVVKSSYNIRR